MRFGLALTVTLAPWLSQSPLAVAGGEGNLNDNVDSIGLSLSLPFGGDRAGEHWLERAEPSLNLGMTGYQPSYWAPCDESCQQRPFTPRAYSLSITGLVEAASELTKPDQDLHLQLGRWRDLFIDPTALPESHNNNFNR
jgi:hypothetical protein